MHLAVLGSAQSGQESIHDTEGTAETLYGDHDAAAAVGDGGSVQPSAETLYDLQFAESGGTTVTLEIGEAGSYVLFTEHVPSEFGAALTDESGAVVEPEATEGAGGHGGESGHGADGGHAGEAGHHDAAVSTAVNKTVSVLSGGLWGVLLGGAFFGIAFYFLEPAIPGTGATRSYVLGAAGFVTVSGAPWLVLPPAAPGARQSLPADTRLLLYGGMMVAGALVCLLSGVAYDRARGSNGPAIAAVAALVPFALLAVPVVLAPTNAVQGALPADLRAGLTGLFAFGQVLLWAALAAAHAQFAPAGDPPTDGAATGRDPTATAD
nr:CbtA family protein [Halobaculum sp. XH14]